MSAMESAPGAHGPPAAGSLYDARRGIFYRKPAWRGWLHLVWFEASLVLGTLLLVRAHGPARVAAVAVYAASVTALFGVSALYHRGNWSAAVSRRLQRADQAMILFLIAGTATPAFLLGMPGLLGRAGLIALWTLTLAAAAVRLVWIRAPERLAGAIFVGLGWIAGLALPGVWIHAGRFRFPRGVPRLRVRGGRVPVHRDRAVRDRRAAMKAGQADALIGAR